MPLTSGEHFAGYRILGLLGSGGMGEVYLAQHPRLPRRDALKVLPSALSADPQYRERFNREAELAATLFHPHIVGIHDRGEADDQLWISMDYIDGTDAGRHLHRHYKNGMPPADVVEIVAAIAEALDYAHSAGLLHRDVKPGNILFTRPTLGRRRILLADFGVARALSDNSDLTKVNTAVGTVNYCSPEQLMGKTLDGRSDQYALATTAFQLLTGAPPFDDPNTNVVVSQHLNSPPPSLGYARPDLAGLDPVFARALAKDPAQRFSSCTEFARALAAYAPVADQPAPPVAPAPIQPVAPPQKPPTAVLPAAAILPPTPVPLAHTPPPAYAPPRRRSGRALPFAIGALVALVVLGLVLVLRGGSDKPAPRSADGTTTITELAPSDPATSESPSTSTTTTPPANGVTFESMRDLVTTYYGQLPGNPDAAWDMLSAGYQRETGRGSYMRFWRSVDSVSVQSVAPRDDDSVVASLTYVVDGRSQSENRWLSAELVDGELLISGSAIT